MDMMYVGVDVGKSKCRAAMMSREGAVLNKFTFNNNQEGISRFSSMLTMDDKVVMESTGAYWVSLYNHLEDAHIRVVLANPLKTKAIASARIKSDKVDAGILAHLLRANLIPENYGAGEVDSIKANREGWLVNLDRPSHTLGEVVELIRRSKVNTSKCRGGIKDEVSKRLDKIGYWDYVPIP